MCHNTNPDHTLLPLSSAHEGSLPTQDQFANLSPIPPNDMIESWGYASRPVNLSLDPLCSRADHDRVRLVSGCPQNTNAGQLQLHCILATRRTTPFSIGAARPAEMGLMVQTPLSPIVAHSCSSKT